MRSALLLLCLVPGCSFPEPSVTDEPLTDTSIVVDSGTEATVDSPVEEASPADADDASSDAITDTKADAPDAPDAPEVYVCPSPDPCDCDGDGDRAKRTGCAGGNDCDDGDPRRNSKVTSFEGHSLAGVVGHTGDWDCNGAVNREYDTGITCTGLLLGDCSKQGYRDATVTCGTDTTFIRCKWNGIACAVDPAATTMIRVKCK